MNDMTVISPSGEIEMSLPELIKKARMDKGMTQKELAEKAGISVSALKQYETGRQDPTSAKITQLASVLELSASDIWSQLPAGNVSDEKLRLTVTSETTRFLTEKATTPDLKKVRQLVAQLSGSGDVGDESELEEQTAVDALSELIETKGLKSRKLVAAVVSAQDELEDVDADDLFILAKDYDVEFEDSIEGQEEEAIARILVAVIYQKDLMDQPLEDLEIIRSWLEDQLSDGDLLYSDLPDELAGKGWFSDKSETEKRLRLHMPVYLLKLANERKFLELELKK